MISSQTKETIVTESGRHRNTIISVQGVRKVYHTDGTPFEALRGLDFAVREGEFVAITGESGSGKSTLLTALGAISAPTSGQVLVDGIDVFGLPIERLADFRREYIGFVFQQFHLIPYLTALENVMLPLCITDMPKARMREAAQDSLGRVGLGNKSSRLPSNLSGGEQQRVAVARALVNEPPIILADEPTGNLDTRTGQEVFSLFESLNRAGETVVLVTHNPALAESAMRTIRLRDGLVESDTLNRA